jgi:hypothetical protein
MPTIIRHSFVRSQRASDPAIKRSEADFIITKFQWITQSDTTEVNSSSNVGFLSDIYTDNKGISGVNLFALIVLNVKYKVAKPTNFPSCNARKLYTILLL